MPEHSATQHLVEDAQDAGQRLDNYLTRLLKGVPKTHIYKILRSGEVRVNGGRVKPGYRVAVNDRIRIPPIRTRQQAEVVAQQGLIERLLSGKLYEDDNFLLINKPAGIAVHGGSSISSGVVEQLRLGTGNARLELVHRLDRGTSGCLLLAKKSAALREAQAAFRERAVKKRYLSMVWGEWPRGLSTLQHRLERYQTGWGERRVRVSAKGQAARTDVRILEQVRHATLLSVSIHTGRTHQIRVHTAHQGHPIVGDDKYAADYPPASRMGLHAERLVVRLKGREIKAVAEPDAEWHALWTALDRKSFPES